MILKGDNQLAELQPKNKVKKVYVCSRLRGNTAGMTEEQKREHMLENIRWVKRVCRAIAVLGLAIPIAPHLYFTQFLDDTVEKERQIGVDFGLQLLDLCDELWVCDTIISKGMQEEIDRAHRTGKPVKYVDRVFFQTPALFIEEMPNDQISAG